MPTGLCLQTAVVSPKPSNLMHQARLGDEFKSNLVAQGSLGINGCVTKCTKGWPYDWQQVIKLILGKKLRLSLSCKTLITGDPGISLRTVTQ